MTEKRFTTRNGVFYTDTKTGYEFQCYGEVADMMNELADENEQLKQSVNNLKETIIKITIAFQRKHDSTIVDLVDEIHEEDISDLIKELME